MAALGEFPKQPAECLFYFFFFLKNSSYSSLPLQTSAWPLTQPHSLTRLGTMWFRVPHGPALPSQCPQSQRVNTTPVYLPLNHFSPQRLQASRSLLVLLKPCLAGEGAVDRSLSQEPCDRPGGHRAWGCSCPGPRAGPKDLIVPKQSHHHMIFQCLLQFGPPTFIYAGIPLAVPSVPWKIG